MVRFVMRPFGWRFDIRGAQHLKFTGPAVIVVNHQSKFDAYGVPLLSKRLLLEKNYIVTLKSVLDAYFSIFCF